MTKIQVKRIYEDREKAEGKRILVDRLWPRGVSKEKANLDLWLKEVGPSNDLRKWFQHDSGKFAEFKKRYLSELEEGSQKEALERLKEEVNNKTTLLTAAKEMKYNHVQILKEILEN